MKKFIVILATSMAVVLSGVAVFSASQPYSHGGTVATPVEPPDWPIESPPPSTQPM